MREQKQRSSRNMLNIIDMTIMHQELMIQKGEFWYNSDGNVGGGQISILCQMTSHKENLVLPVRLRTEAFEKNCKEILP